MQPPSPKCLGLLRTENRVCGQVGAHRLQRGKGVCGSILGYLGLTFSICEMGPLPFHPLAMVFIKQRGNNTQVLNVGASQVFPRNPPGFRNIDSALASACLGRASVHESYSWANAFQTLPVLELSSLRGHPRQKVMRDRRSLWGSSGYSLGGGT
jgi:hypothetical protein